MIHQLFFSNNFFFSSRRRHTISYGDWSSDVCSSDLYVRAIAAGDLGQSARFKAPVRDVIGKHLANTAFLAVIAFEIGRASCREGLYDYAAAVGLEQYGDATYA